jgi:hypothetical protein
MGRGTGGHVSFELRVDCYAGHRGEQTPRRFSLGGRAVEVGDVLDAWLAPDHRDFKLRGDDGACYILRNDVLDSRWELTMYDRAAARPRGGSDRRWNHSHHPGGSRDR